MAKRRKRKNVDDKLALAFFVVPPIALIGFIVFALVQQDYVTNKAAKKRREEFGGY